VATVAELTAPYGNFLLGPRRGPGVCRTCFNLTDGYPRCYACAHGGRWLDAVAPISYSVAGEQLHHALQAYKRGDTQTSRAFTVELAAVLWRFLSGHERCVARAANAPEFPLVTTVPSSDPARDDEHPLHAIVGCLVKITAGRHRRLLRRAATDARPHEFSADRYETTAPLDGEAVLVIDDTWTTGANAQGAAAALKRAGAGAVAAVVIGRHLNRSWGSNDRQISGLQAPFDWDCCALCSRRGATCL